MRQKSESVGALGRVPARTTKIPLAPAPPTEPVPERGASAALRRWLHAAMFDNVGLKFLSMVLAVTVFLLVNTDRDSEITTRVKVLYSGLPSDKVLMSDRLEDVRVTIKGSWRALRRLDERTLEPITLDLSRAATGDIAITDDMIHPATGHLSAGLTIASITPRSVHVAFDRRVEKTVEVTPQVAGRPQHGYVVAEVKAVPATIAVRGAEGTLAALTAVRTREVSVEGRTDSFTADTSALPPDGVELEGSPQVMLHITVDEELVTRKLPGLVVGIRGDNIDPAKWSVTPSQVEITLTGTLLAVEKAKAALVPVVKLAPDGKREADVTIEGLPPGIGVKVSPERVKVMPVKPASPP